MKKGSEAFKTTIERYVISMGIEVTTDKKNIDDCITYILNTVQKSGCQGFNDHEIYDMAITYYNTPDLDLGKPVTCNVVVNHQVELTPEEIEEARKKAIADLQAAEKKKILDRAAAKKNTPAGPVVQQTLW